MINLHIPKQSETKDSPFPDHPGKFKKWLANLPQANMGENTRQIFTALMDLNRKQIPIKHRLEILEMLQDPSRRIFEHLKKYFINRTFPLPEKSKKIVNLNQALLQEMALGYKIVAQKSIEQSEKLDSKSTTIAIARAIKYHGELFLRASEIYTPLPKHVWHDSHQMFAHAIANKWHKKTIKDIEHPDKKTHIENSYKQMLLFSLSRPTALRQSDIERVYQQLYNWSALSDLDVEAQEKQINRFFCTRIDQDNSPSYLNQQDCDNGKPVFTLDTSKLVAGMQKKISAAEKNKEAITVGEELSIETLQLLSDAWGVMPERRFTRVGKEGHVAAAIGLTYAAKIIGESHLPDSLKAMSDVFDSEASFTLENIPEELKIMSEKPLANTTQVKTKNKTDSAWNKIAKGNIMTNTFHLRQKALEAQLSKRHKEEDDLHWEVINISAGGYCLRWNSTTASKAQIGELIAVHSHDAKGDFEWHIGGIRWMQFTPENGLEIGVQIISPKVIAAQAYRLNKAKEAPFEALMIPGIRPLKQTASIILPAHAFRTGDRLKVDVFEKHIEIELSQKKEHTGSFTQFQFMHLNKKIQKNKTNKKEDSDKKKDDFDELWSSL